MTSRVATLARSDSLPHTAIIPLGFQDVSFNMDIVGGAAHRSAKHSKRLSEPKTASNASICCSTTGRTRSSITAADANGRTSFKDQAQPGRLLVRIPPWVDAPQSTLDGAGEPPTVENGYLVIEEEIARSGATINLRPREEIIPLKHRTRTIRVQLRGDSVVAMDNFGAPMTFFDSL